MDKEWIIVGHVPDTSAKIFQFMKTWKIYLTNPFFSNGLKSFFFFWGGGGGGGAGAEYEKFCLGWFL